MVMPPPSTQPIQEPSAENETRVKSPPPAPFPNLKLRSKAAKQMAEPPIGESGVLLLRPLRELSAEMLDLKMVLIKVQQGDASLASFAPYVNRTISDVDELISSLKDGDTIRHILNTWEQMKANPLIQAPDGDHDAQEQLQNIKILDELIDKVVYLCGTLTIPTRLNEWLKTTRPGYYIPFSTVFEDELPNPADRQRLLNFLAWAPTVIENGIVDLDAGLIYRYSNQKKERLLSMLYVALAFVVFSGLVIGSCYLGLPSWPLSSNNLTVMISGWLALLVGIIVHIGIGSIKRARERAGLPSILAFGEIQFQINARAGQIILKLFIALVGFFGLILASGIDNVSLLNSFLVGYSLDSFVEMFGSNLEQRAGSQLNALQQQLNAGQD
jgi:hypothetical protein